MPEAEYSFKAGAARIVTSPPVGGAIAGDGFGHSQGILADLAAQALYLASGGECAVILTLDLLAVGAEFVTWLRQKAAAALADHRLAGAFLKRGLGPRGQRC